LRSNLKMSSAASLRFLDIIASCNGLRLNLSSRKDKIIALISVNCFLIVYYSVIHLFIIPKSLGEFLQWASDYTSSLLAISQNWILWYKRRQLLNIYYKIFNLLNESDRKKLRNLSLIILFLWLLNVFIDISLTALIFTSAPRRYSIICYYFNCDSLSPLFS